MKKLIMGSSLVAALALLSACGSDSGDDEISVITFADAGWESIRVHNAIAQFIIENGYEYETETTMGSTAITVQGLRDGDINAYMEIWTDNIRELYDESIESEEIIEVSTNFDDNVQGLYVPTYVIEGDEERGIEPMAPDLRTVEDLANYPEVFQDPEDSSMGRILNAPSDWAVHEDMSIKFETYGLGDTFNLFSPGSDSAMVIDLVRAYEAGEGWVGYYWEPTGITAQYDLTLLEEAPYDEEQWNEDRSTEFPPNDVTVAVNQHLPDQAPEVVEFLENYETSSELTEVALAYMEEDGLSEEEAAMRWMEEHQDLWTSWLPDDIADKVLDAME
ncbi:ABC transporter substrate-binding protein [Bacillus sp. JCM 19045]|uniref:Glycine betaine/proline transport system substrate-binding protein n=1 Tax=Shouchella xiaoxiensis TaxID=766895 RepID=A0ABS2SXT8_9BACI|nr:ABC transporter substrate-binding protein [Shouchella xiaoxiensis]MBM7840050.1 glycine betaine/proline transport system substrate-binding protein [Shouchella xiaoxiensis]GAF12587.1 ABC transporter substrate-binding protein [Bacillus sp. JCM 19045]